MTGDVVARLAGLSTAHLADGCLRAGEGMRCAPWPTRPARTGDRLAGPVLAARHAGSVDVFLEAIGAAHPGDVLVIDNGGRTDESCIGDLVVAEAAAAGLAGIVVWGLHRDSADLPGIGLPVWSLGTVPAGPLGTHGRLAGWGAPVRVGSCDVGPDDWACADDDGVIFVRAAALDRVLEAAEGVRDVERAQARGVREGHTLREQLQFDRYLARRREQPGLTFREHLRAIGGAIEQ